MEPNLILWVMKRRARFLERKIRDRLFADPDYKEYLKLISSINAHNPHNVKKDFLLIDLPPKKKTAQPRASKVKSKSLGRYLVKATT